MAAYGPESATDSARHNHTKLVVVHLLGNVFGLLGVIFPQLPQVTFGQKYEILLPLPIIMVFNLVRFYFYNAKI
jgi:hypothetical protein